MEYVVLVDEHNNEIGTAPKQTVHTTDTPLHRGFSCFIFNDKNQLLLTKRASVKKTFPGLWTNTVCGHPAPGETPGEAATRRLEEELGLSVSDVREVAPYKYRFADQNGIVEHEICPILLGYTNEDPRPRDHEVDAWKWVDWKAFLHDVTMHPDRYSPWSREEAEILNTIVQ